MAPEAQLPAKKKRIKGECVKIEYITLWVSNARQAASYFVSFLGFQPLAYKGLETGSRQFASHAVVQEGIIFLFVTSLTKNPEFSQLLDLHGDFVKDIAFRVDDIEMVLERVIAGGADLERDLWYEEDENGLVKFASVKNIGDVTHTFVDKTGYKGDFLPGFYPSTLESPTISDLFPPGLSFIDHCVATRFQDSIDSSCRWYEKSLSFHRFWSVDDIDVQTKSSSLKFLVVANSSETIKLTILEPASGTKKSQVQEFNEYNGGPGIQHIALHTDNIIESVKNLRRRGTQFLTVPDNYYESLRERLKSAKINVKEDLDQLQDQQILLDFDDHGYLLQIFTKPLQDRPTLFLEIIQRHNHNGFGAGNFRALFAAVEKEQEMRGNL